MSSSEDYVKLIVDSLQLQSTAYEDNYAVSKAYVDDVKSSIMGSQSGFSFQEQTQQVKPSVVRQQTSSLYGTDACI